MRDSPDPDNDADGILDSADACRDEPEDRDGFEDADGCPDGGRPQRACAPIVIDDAVRFETASDAIQSSSFEALDGLAARLQQAEHIKRVRVEGHTDNRGSSRYNLQLSKRRAASVVQYLTQHGVQAERLVSEGYGLTKPIADNETESGRAQNRRVEFVVEDQATDCTP